MQPPPPPPARPKAGVALPVPFSPYFPLSMICLPRGEGCFPGSLCLSSLSEATCSVFMLEPMLSNFQHCRWILRSVQDRAQSLLGSCSVQARGLMLLWALPFSALHVLCQVYT